MVCELLIMDEYGHIEENLGVITKNFLDKLIKLAEENNLIFLSGIEEYADTIFNSLQLNQIKKVIKFFALNYNHQDIDSLEMTFFIR